jgi:hypothetical protein
MCIFYNVPCFITNFVCQLNFNHKLFAESKEQKIILVVAILISFHASILETLVAIRKSLLLIEGVSSNCKWG